jgi:ribosomal protein S18 acetylase RimI-like enzyme
MYRGAGKMTNVAVTRLAEADIAAAGDTLARAFHDDPIQTYVFPDAEERARLAPAQFSMLVREGHLFGEVFATAGTTGVSAWMPPENVTTPEQAAKSGMRELPQLMGKDAFTRFGTVLDYLSNTHQKGMPAKSWYLMVIGVRPDQRGSGLGRALLVPVLARADAERMPICLDTAQPRVRSLYERLGFKATAESVHAQSGLRLWSYLREPI